MTICRGTELRKLKIGSLRHALFCILLCMFWGAANAITTNQDGNKCQLISEDQVTLTTDIVKNGRTYSDVEITINEYRGYKCRQAYSTGKSCKSLSILPSRFKINTDGDTYGGLRLEKMCHPTATNHVTRKVEVTVGGTLLSVDVEWSNITECSCDMVI